MESKGITRQDTYIDVKMAEMKIKNDKDLAEIMGVSQQTLSFRLNKKISMDTLIRLSSVFETTIKELLR